MGESEEFDAIMVESKEITVTEDSVVCISPYNTKTNKWLCGMMEITTMRDVIGRKKIKISKDKNVEDFFTDYYKKKNPWVG